MPDERFDDPAVFQELVRKIHDTCAGTWHIDAYHHELARGIDDQPVLVRVMRFISTSPTGRGVAVEVVHRGGTPHHTRIRLSIDDEQVGEGTATDRKDANFSTLVQTTGRFPELDELARAIAAELRSELEQRAWTEQRRIESEVAHSRAEAAMRQYEEERRRLDDVRRIVDEAF